jgi:polysaccharide export outer membrane protein
MIPHTSDEYFLQTNDVVDINMRTNDPELNLLLDANASGDNQFRMNANMLGGGDIFYLNGYTLNDNGVVNIPVIGNVKLVGLNLEEAKAAIEEELKKYVLENEYYVRVRLGGIRYSALGEFVRPGKYTLLQNRVTIFEAIANAGDLTTLAKRSKIRLIRQYPEGSRSYRINLNSDKIMNTEFYFLRPNDMIYAEPLKIRELGTGTTLSQTFQLLINVATIGILIYSTTN